MNNGNKYKVIDIDNWKGKKHYLWFKEYKTPYYGMTVRMDITKLYKLIKEKKYSFFISFMYIINIALSEIEEFRLRIKGNDVLLYDKIHPAYTVMTNDGVFDNCNNEFVEDFLEFNHITRNAIEKVKVGLKMDKEYNDPNTLDQFYYTCLPWIDFINISHPMTDDNNSCIPRIVWGKYDVKEEKTEITLGIQVNHALVDGKPLSDAFIKIQEMLDNVNLYIK